MMSYMSLTKRPGDLVAFLFILSQEWIRFEWFLEDSGFLWRNLCLEHGHKDFILWAKPYPDGRWLRHSPLPRSQGVRPFIRLSSRSCKSQVWWWVESMICLKIKLNYAEFKVVVCDILRQAVLLYNQVINQRIRGPGLLMPQFDNDNPSSMTEQPFLTHHCHSLRFSDQTNTNSKH